MTPAEQLLIERLRQHILHYSEQEAAADLFEAKDARIAELEAERDHHKDWVAHLTKELAALRKRIDEAPVVGYHFSRNDNFKRIVWDVDHAVHPDAIEYRSLISKEDLQR